MTAINEEELLLHDTATDGNADNFKAPFDEDILLGSISRTSTLQSEEIEAQKGVGEPSTNLVDESYEKEELDYEEDEEEEKQERTSRFTSERRRELPSGEGKKETTAAPERGNFVGANRGAAGFGFNRGRGNFNGTWRGRGGNPRMNNFGCRPMGMGPPPLMGSPVPPPFAMFPPQQQPLAGLMGQSKILVNPNFHVGPAPSAQPPLVRLKIDGAPPQIFGAPPMQMPMNIPSAPSIVPRLPNGIPLTGMPANHGAAGFGTANNERMQGGGGMPMMGPPMGAGQQWNQAVHQFLNNASSTSRRDSSSSSDYSYSDSDSYSSRSRSRSRSARRRHSRSRGTSGRERGSRRHDDERRRERTRRFGDSNSHKESSRRRPTHQDHHASIECAKAIGLSNDYLAKMDEQKKKRDEVIRKKEQRRFAYTSSTSHERTNSQRQLSQRPSQPQQHGRHPAPMASSSSSSKGTRRGESTREQQPPPQPTSSAASNDRRMKAYLAVNVGNTKQLPTARARVETLAKELGPIRKCWQSKEDTISVIFVEHVRAKDFMLKYNKKVIAGLRVDVSLEKKYLNINEIN